MMKRLAALPLLALATCENQEPPAACGSIREVIVLAGEATTVVACFTNPNGDRLMYSAASSNPGVAAVSVADSAPSTDSEAPSPPLAAPGVLTVTAVAAGGAAVTVTAHNPGGLTATQEFTVTVPYPPERLTDNHRWARYPAWSPDRTRIAFTSNRDGSYKIYLMDADGSDQTRLTNNSADDYGPSWSPDGTQITFISGRDSFGKEEIYAIRIR